MYEYWKVTRKQQQCDQCVHHKLRVYLLFQNQYFHVFSFALFYRLFACTYRYICFLFMCIIFNAWFKVSCFLFPFILSCIIQHSLCGYVCECVWCLLHFWTIIRDKVLFWWLHAIIHNVNIYTHIHSNRCDCLRQESIFEQKEKRSVWKREFVSMCVFLIESPRKTKTNNKKRSTHWCVYVCLCMLAHNIIYCERL